jgi:hypothetical protein
MIDAAPLAWYSSKFKLFRDGREVGLLKPGLLTERATFEVKDVTFEFYREGWVSDFVLEFEGATLARADKPSALTRRFVLTIEGQCYVLEAESAWRRAFRLRAEHDEEVLGRIAPKSPFTRRATLDLPEDLPLPVQAFCFWLVVVLWNRAAAATAGSG